MEHWRGFITGIILTLHQQLYVNTTDCTDSADLEYGLTEVRIIFRLSLTKRVYSIDLELNPETKLISGALSHPQTLSS